MRVRAPAAPLGAEAADPGQAASLPPAGRHLIAECFGPATSGDADTFEALLRRAAGAGGARVLSCHMHGFGSGGVTGVALLAESHITVHTWPERGYAAFDVFMCGGCDADAAVDAIVAAAPWTRVCLRAIDRPVRASGDTP